MNNLQIEYSFFSDPGHKFFRKAKRSEAVKKKTEKKIGMEMKSIRTVKLFSGDTEGKKVGE